MGDQQSAPRVEPTQGPYRVAWRGLLTGEKAWSIVGPQGQCIGVEGVDSVGASDAHLLAASWEMPRVLQGLEWSQKEGYWRPAGGTIYIPRCPSCLRRQEDGHAPDCPLALALAHARGERLEEHSS